jgi:hypothetical protein
MLKLNDAELKQNLYDLIKNSIVALPLAVGIVHQFLMAFFGIEDIYVFVDPPGRISPWASVQFEWWIVLLFGTTTLFVMLFFRRLPRVPRRMIYPVYFYLVFLLIWIKPV